ncbi:hypothetical protein [Desertivirga brevis]|uniref:hypothetical protein n=1 Tax=Desertivirga brevis TaxID=2810310 RepID=UPI001A95875B|nr:hypothetical protein [Pedobacter sp. SYSU D00873]
MPLKLGYFAQNETPPRSVIAPLKEGVVHKCYFVQGRQGRRFESGLERVAQLVEHVNALMVHYPSFYEFLEHLKVP